MAMGSAVVCGAGMGLRFRLSGRGACSDSAAPSFSGVVFAEVAGVVVVVADALALGDVVALSFVTTAAKGVYAVEPCQGPAWTTGLCVLVFVNAGCSAKSGAR